MRDLSMHITDIVQNSVRAQAKLVQLTIEEKEDWLIFTFEDDGTGMDEETVKKVTDPFFTSRTTRKVGLGLPLFKQNAEMTGGSLVIFSELGKGTEVKVVMGLNHIDRPPMGDLPSTVAMIITGNPDVDMVFKYIKSDSEFSLDSREVKEALDGMDIRMPQVTSFLKEMIDENLKEIKVNL
ncbi:sensor histidine kinase [Carboxylicivirga linearis]|uniref:histidine kinase n=1 Tax=Carboxylicivirga linearis TaxID=1628157 RepID=A0ABS5JZ24_9BACT|nr:ATP-binding protein [Carboxylicivirga linearis]MBS2100167.1 ATP-binding protein [Carboxylicivirga linearis]